MIKLLALLAALVMGAGYSQATPITVSFDLFGPGIDGQSLPSLTLANSGISLSIIAETVHPTGPIVPATVTGNANSGGLGVNSGSVDQNDRLGLLATHNGNEYLKLSLSGAPAGFRYHLDSVTMTHANYTDTYGTLDPISTTSRLIGEYFSTAVNVLGGNSANGSTGGISVGLNPLWTTEFALDYGMTRSGIPDDLSELTLTYSAISPIHQETIASTSNPDDMIFTYDFGPLDKLLLLSTGAHQNAQQFPDGIRIKRLTFTASDKFVSVPETGGLMCLGIGLLGLCAFARIPRNRLENPTANALRGT